jgi:hypothetical protein
VVEKDLDKYYLENIIMDVILFVMIGVLFVSLIISNEKRIDMRYNLEIVQHENKLLKDKIKNFEYENELLKSYRNYYYQNQTRSKANSEDFNDEIKEAVRYAMKKSHPDNGGSAKDFDKFRKLYNSMK